VGLREPRIQNLHFYRGLERLGSDRGRQASPIAVEVMRGGCDGVVGVGVAQEEKMISAYVGCMISGDKVQGLALVTR
jgi:hypothetical protein